VEAIQLEIIPINRIQHPDQIRTHPLDSKIAVVEITIRPEITHQATAVTILEEGLPEVVTGAEDPLEVVMEAVGHLVEVDDNHYYIFKSYAIWIKMHGIFF
jgi:hypothetical protein